MLSDQQCGHAVAPTSKLAPTSHSAFTLQFLTMPRAAFANCLNGPSLEFLSTSMSLTVQQPMNKLTLTKSITRRFRLSTRHQINEKTGQHIGRHDSQPRYCPTMDARYQYHGHAERSSARDSYQCRRRVFKDTMELVSHV